MGLGQYLPSFGHIPSVFLGATFCFVAGLALLGSVLKITIRGGTSVPSTSSALRIAHWSTSARWSTSVHVGA
ncbi:Os01g0364000 [Oryza sativa Japonica Group]|uniref:Os01g0364000 protein n=1 Tax=Oryza sativa subsp. japonica TaxID=39947 RepID=A0A0P0V2F9_ORYSJ|nr:hypothetical protein EE612_002604 [Oryza sativa]KAB8081418.1 hypothetical protein EE612_002604 [Oryza sativa]BAS72124.1 Os01g0364000 [Oryza sativa Japonica Group]